VVQLVEALRYKPEDHWNFSLTMALGVETASYRNEYQQYFLGVKAAGDRADKLNTFMCRLS
jgi:hypothetical protein